MAEQHLVEFAGQPFQKIYSLFSYVNENLCTLSNIRLNKACGSSWEYQKIKPGSEFPWILAYVPIKSCYRVLKDKYGEFSPPMYHSDSPINFSCNWTIWAGSRKHIIIYIQGFIAKEGCNKNEDKILFEGVSSLVEDSVVYACWKKETHVFATFAEAVHVVLLKRYLPNCRGMRFKGKYYIFQDQEGDSSSKHHVISETSAPKLPKQDSIFHTEWAEKVRDVLGLATTHSTTSFGKTTVLSSELKKGRGVTLGTTAVGSPVTLVPYEHARTQLLETKAASVLGSELLGGLRCCKEAQDRGTPGGVIPIAAQDNCGQSFSVSGDTTLGFGYTCRLSSVLLETPLLGTSQVTESFLQPEGVGLENRQSLLHPTLRPEDLGNLQFVIKPTHTSFLDIAAQLQTLSPGRRESKESTDTATYRGLSTISLEKDESHPQLSLLADGTVSDDADGPANGLMPSLSSPYEVVSGGRLHLLPERNQRCQSSFGDLSTIQPELETTGLQHTQLMGILPLESFEGVERKTVLHPTTLWDVLQEHFHLCGHSSHILQSAHGSLPQNAQAHNYPVTEKACASFLGVKSCYHQSDRDAQRGLAAPPLPTGMENAPTPISTLEIETIPVLVSSCTEPVPVDFGSTNFTPKAPLLPEVEPVFSIVFSPPAPLDLDPVSLRQRAGVSTTSPGGQEMVPSSPPCHPPVASELGMSEPTGCLGPGLQKLAMEEVGGQQGEASASKPQGLLAGGPSPASVTGPKHGMGLPWLKDHVSSGSGVATASVLGTWGVSREEHVAPVEHQAMAASDKTALPFILGGFERQKTTEALQVGAAERRNDSSSATSAHPDPPVAWGSETVLKDQKSQEPPDDPLPRNTQMPEGHQQKHAELGRPWMMEYFPIRSCHTVFQDGSGMFYLPLHADIKTNIWCNWTICAGSQKHIVIYVQGFQGSDGCGNNQDKIIFQGVSSSVETKVVYACHNQGTLIFATQATAVHVLFLSGSGSLSHEYGHFKGRYYIFEDFETVGSSNATVAPKEHVQETSKEESWRIVVTKGLFPMLRASPSPSAVPADGRIHLEFVSQDEEAQHVHGIMEDAQSGANMRKLNLCKHDQLRDETELESILKDGSAEGRETADDVLVELAPAGQDAGCKAESSALEIAKVDTELVSAPVMVVPCHSACVSSSEVPSNNIGLSAKSSSLGLASDGLSAEVVTAAAHNTQMPVLEEPLLNMSAKPSPFPSPGVTAGDIVSTGESQEDLFDLASVLASLENDMALQSQHHPGDVLFEVTIEIQAKDWIPHGGSELQKGLLEFVKNHIQENLKLSANRVNEMKLKEIKRTSDANLLLTFWLHLKPEERNMSLLLHSQLEELLGTSVGMKKLQLVSLLVEDVNECSAGVSLCGEEAECFNSAGTYLCRCKKGYEDHSPTKSGTLCIRTPRSGISFFLQHADILVGAAIVSGLAMLVAAGVLCWQRWHPRRNPSLEESPVRVVEEPVIELHDLGECLRLDPFQLKLRARPPEWLWGARAHPSQV
ncbi:hypothetical protein Q9233_005482 [Columba guinea]|nr:hypothetical protein Q9233_005482 [Columba guinea]